MLTYQAMQTNYHTALMEGTLLTSRSQCMVDLLHMHLLSLRRLQRPLLVPSILNCKIISHYLFHYICTWFFPIKHISKRWDEKAAIEADPEINCFNPSHECEWRNHSSEVLYYGRYRKVYFPWLSVLDGCGHF